MKLVLAFLLLVTPAFAQLDSGTIVGYVRDQSGAAVQSATILITSEATNAQWTVKSDDHGDYVSPPLRAGMYSVRVEATGFKSATKENVTIQVQDRLRVDFDMSIGAVTDNVVVSADSQLIQTETSSLGQVISSKQITDLPLNGRDYVQLATLTTGVVRTSSGTNGNIGGSSTGGQNSTVTSASHRTPTRSGKPSNIERNPAAPRSPSSSMSLGSSPQTSDTVGRLG